jgi:hypothetical protein
LAIELWLAQSPPRAVLEAAAEAALVQRGLR